jgi:hypothetical protein
LVGGVTFLLSVDMLRELEIDASALWIQAGAIAVIMAECRWVLHFLSLPDLLAAVFMLVVFYVMTGLIQDSVTGRISRGSWTTYGGVFAIAAVFILFARLLT